MRRMRHNNLEIRTAGHKRSPPCISREKHNRTQDSVEYVAGEECGPGSYDCLWHLREVEPNGAEKNN